MCATSLLKTGLCRELWQCAHARSLKETVFHAFFFSSRECMSVNTLFGSCFLRLQQWLFVAGCLWPTYRGELFLFVRKRWRRGVLPKRWGGRCLAHATPGFWRAVSGGKNEMLYKTAWKKVCQDVALLFSYCNELYGCLSNITPLCCVLLSRRSVGEYSTKKDEKKKLTRNTQCVPLFFHLRF